MSSSIVTPLMTFGAVKANSSRDKGKMAVAVTVIRLGELLQTVRVAGPGGSTAMVVTRTPGTSLYVNKLKKNEHCALRE
jgi:hypothetical protein